MASSSQQAPAAATAAMGPSQFDIWHGEITEEIHALDLEEDVGERIVLRDLVPSQRKFVHHLVNEYKYLSRGSKGRGPNKVLVISKLEKPKKYKFYNRKKRLVCPNGTTDDRLVSEYVADDGGRFYSHKDNGRMAYVAKGCHHPVYISESCMDSGKVNAGGSAGDMMADASNSGLRGKVDERIDGRPRAEALSRMMGALLRHRAVDFGVEVGADAYAALQHVLGLSQFRKHKPELEEMIEIINTDGKVRRGKFKARFTLIDRAPKGAQYNLYYVKASQGHTMKFLDDDALLTEIKGGELEVCCHGTFERLWFWKKKIKT